MSTQHQAPEVTSEDVALAERIRKRGDAIATSLLYGSSTVSSGKPEPFSLDVLARLIESAPPAEVWLSSRLFAADSAIRVSGRRVNFTCSHPDFWAKMRDELARSDQVEQRPGGLRNPIAGMTLNAIEIDSRPDDGADTAKWRKGYWDQLREAFMIAMGAPPDWLR